MDVLVALQKIMAGIGLPAGLEPNLLTKAI